MPLVNPFASETSASGTPPLGGPSRIVNPFGSAGAPGPSEPALVASDVGGGFLEPVFKAGRWAVGEVGAGVRDVLRALRIPQQASAIALADFVVTHGRAPSVSEWLQTASQAVRSDESFSDVLGKAGLPAGLTRNLEGIFLDIVADPLWLVSPAKVAKIAGVPKMIEAFRGSQAGQTFATSPTVRKGMRLFVDPYFGLPQEFIDARLKLQVGVGKGYRTGVEQYGQPIAKLTPEEQRYITRYQELGTPGQYGQVVSGTGLQDTTEQLKLFAEAEAKGLNVESIRTLSQLAKTADLNQLRELVDLGVFKKSVVDPFWDLPGHGLPGGFVDADRQRALNEMFKSNPTEYARRVARGNAMELPLPSAHMRREYRFYEDPDGFIRKMAQSKPPAEEIKRLMKLHGRDPVRLQQEIENWGPRRAEMVAAWWRTRSGFTTSGTFKPFALNFGFITPRDPAITGIMREAMGEIREAAHPITTSLVEGTRFIELHKFLTKVAQDWGKTDAEAARLGYKGLKYVENKKIWGDLAGKWLPEVIAEDILRTVGRDNMGWGLLSRKIRQGIGWWKYGKIVLSPASHARIVLHNLALWDWSGAGGVMKTHRLMQSARALAQGEKNQLYREMNESGVVLHHTFAEQQIDDLLTRDPSIIQDAAGWADVQHNLEQTSKNIFRVFGKPAEALLAFEERLFKGATFAEYRAQGKSIEEAGRLTNEALLNYKRLPEFWNSIRQFGIVPFVAFPLQATTRVARAITHRPAVVGKYGKVFRDIETARSGLTPGQIEAEKSVLPPEMDQGVGWVRLGRAPDGTVRYLNVSYVLPLWILPESFRALPYGGGSVASGVRNWTSALQGGFMNISAYPIAKAAIEGVDPFTNKKFRSFDDFLIYLYKFATPSLISTTPQQLWAAAYGTPVDLTSKGKPKAVRDVLARNFLAWSTQDKTPMMEKVYRMRELQHEIADVRREMARLGAAPYLSSEDRDRLMSEQVDKIRSIVSVLSRLGETEIPATDPVAPAADALPQPLHAGAQMTPQGLLTQGTIDPFNRPRVPGPGGTYSTLRTITITDDQGRAVLLPTVIDGKIVSPEEAVQHYRQTGQHLGIFATEADAQAYDRQLHDQIEPGSYDRKPVPAKGLVDPF